MAFNGKGRDRYARLPLLGQLFVIALTAVFGLLVMQVLERNAEEMAEGEGSYR